MSIPVQIWLSDVLKLVPFVGWTTHKLKTTRDRNRTNPILSICIMLRCLATPLRWKELEVEFGRHFSQLCEIFWERIE